MMHHAPVYIMTCALHFVSALFHRSKNLNLVEFSCGAKVRASPKPLDQEPPQDDLYGVFQVSPDHSILMDPEFLQETLQFWSSNGSVMVFKIAFTRSLTIRQRWPLEAYQESETDLSPLRFYFLSFSCTICVPSCEFAAQGLANSLVICRLAINVTFPNVRRYPVPYPVSLSRRME